MAGAFAGFQNEIYVAGLEDVRPELPTDLTKLEALAAETMPAKAFAYVAGSAGSEATARANRAAFEAGGSCRGCCATSPRATCPDLLGTPMPAPAAARAGRRPVDRASGRRCGARAAALGLPIVVSTRRRQARGRRPGVGDGAALVPALLAEGPRGRLSFLQRAKAGGLRRAGRDARHLDAGLAAARPRRRVPAVPQGRRDRELLHRPGLPGGARRPAAEDTRAAVLHWAPMFANPALTWDDSRSCATTGRADRPQGDPAPGRRAPRGRRRRRRGRRVEPRRPPGGRRDRVARRAPRRRRGGGRAARGAVRHGRPHRRGRRKALALGAKAVLLGRPFVYGLALGGEAGVGTSCAACSPSSS